MVSSFLDISKHTGKKSVFNKIGSCLSQNPKNSPNAVLKSFGGSGVSVFERVDKPLFNKYSKPLIIIVKKSEVFKQF